MKAFFLFCKDSEHVKKMVVNTLCMMFPCMGVLKPQIHVYDSTYMYMYILSTTVVFFCVNKPYHRVSG